MRLPPLGKKAKDWLSVAVEVALIFALLYAFCWPYSVDGGSMLPGIADGDRVVISRFDKWRGSIMRGDAVAARNPYEKGKRIIKRVVALPGDVVKDVGVMVIVNGQTAYAKDGVLDVGRRDFDWGAGTPALTLGEDEYFLLGDNFTDSVDSRAFGPVKGGSIIGRQFGRVWPPAKFYISFTRQ